MQKTKIEYLTHTWNPIAMRCTPVSGGCANCWHLSMAKRLSKNPLPFPKDQIAYGGGPFHLDTDRLEAPLHLKKPTRIGVQFMGDLFHESVSSMFINSIVGIMTAEETGHHTFFVLTKRPQNMEAYFKSFTRCGVDLARFLERVWLGVSVEDQKTYDERASILSRIKCAHRWISFEPLLGQITTEFMDWQCDWAVCGCESGPKRRPCKVEWIRNLKNECVRAGVPFFLKQGPGYFCGISGIYKMPELDGKKWKEEPDDLTKNGFDY